MKISVKKTAIILSLLLGLTACSRSTPKIVYSGTDGRQTAQPTAQQQTTAVSETTVSQTQTDADTADETDTDTAAEPASKPDADPRSFFGSVTVCGKEFSLPFSTEDLTGDFSYEFDSHDVSGFDVYKIYYGSTNIGMIGLYEDGSTATIGLFESSEYKFDNFEVFDDPDRLKELLGTPENRKDGKMTFRFDDMRAVFRYYYGADGAEKTGELVIIFGDFTDKTNRDILRSDILEDIDGETEFEYSDIADSIVIDGIQLPHFPFSEKHMPSEFKVEEFVGGDALVYKGERIADIDVIRCSVAYIGFYAESMEKYDISAAGITYDMSEEEIRAVLGRPNCSRSTPDRFIYILDEDKVVAVNLSGYRNTYYPLPEPTDSNYVSIGVSGRKKFNS
ncbi:MAG: hypothetical protein ILP19_02410 [Oscillospiraceae bacterium]|nr:hypothetical protein [Oscillospiraceae bacterium]